MDDHLREKCVAFENQLAPLVIYRDRLGDDPSIWDPLEETMWMLNEEIDIGDVAKAKALLSKLELFVSPSENGLFRQLNSLQQSFFKEEVYFEVVGKLYHACTELLRALRPTQLLLARVEELEKENKDLRQRLDTSNEKILCAFCEEREVNRVTLCGHCMCDICAAAWMESFRSRGPSLGRIPLCPTCRTNPNDALQRYQNQRRAHAYVLPLFLA